MKMTLLALAGRGGFFGASGLRNLPPVSAARAKKASPSSPASATPPKPPPSSHRNSRRVRPQNWRAEVVEVVMRHPWQEPFAGRISPDLEVQSRYLGIVALVARRQFRPVRHTN